MAFFYKYFGEKIPLESDIAVVKMSTSLPPWYTPIGLPTPYFQDLDVYVVAYGFGLLFSSTFALVTNCSTTRNSPDPFAHCLPQCLAIETPFDSRTFCYQLKAASMAHSNLDCTQQPDDGDTCERFRQFQNEAPYELEDKRIIIKAAGYAHFRI